MYALADGVLAGPVALGERAIHDDYQRSCRTIRLRKIAATQQGDTRGSKVIAHHLGIPGQIQAGALGGNVAFRNKGNAADLPRRGQHGGNSNRLHARQLLQFAVESCIESVHGGLRSVLFVWQAIRGGECVVGAEAQID